MGQSASFTPRTLTLGAMSTGVKQSNSSWNSQCDKHVMRRLSLINDHQSTAQDRRDGLIWFIWFVLFIWFTDWTNETNQTDQIN
jgi:hypothetical protein